MVSSSKSLGTLRETEDVPLPLPRERLFRQRQEAAAKSKKHPSERRSIMLFLFRGPRRDAVTTASLVQREKAANRACPCVRSSR